MAQVLVVDDSGFQRGIVQRALEGTGHSFLEAPNGRVGLEMIKQHQPEVVLLDILMPEMDGIQVLRALREQAISVPVIVLTSDIQLTTREQCLGLGARAFLNKPVKDFELRKALEEILADAPQGV